jgi:hypothetical protein
LHTTLPLVVLYTLPIFLYLSPSLSLSLSPPLSLQELPDPATLQAMQEQYPPVIHATNPQSFDLKTHPYGCLTRRGVAHLQAMGALLRGHFPALAHLEAQPPEKLKVGGGGCGSIRSSLHAVVWL